MKPEKTTPVCQNASGAPQTPASRSSEPFPTLYLSHPSGCLFAALTRKYTSYAGCQLDLQKKKPTFKQKEGKGCYHGAECGNCGQRRWGAQSVLLWGGAAPRRATPRVRSRKKTEPRYFSCKAVSPRKPFSYFGKDKYS